MTKTVTGLYFGIIYYNLNMPLCPHLKSLIGLFT
jgi:hypothetical protein